MDVKTLCLGVLTEGDQTGYAIKQRFEEAFSHFFSAGFGSIYPALAGLTDEGLVTCESVEQDKRPDKKVYSLTEAGRAALAAELMATPPRHKVRSEFLVLMYFAHLLPAGRVAAIIEQMIAIWEPLLAEIDSFVGDGTTSPEGIEMTPGMRFVAGCGRAAVLALLEHVRSQKDELVGAVADANARQRAPVALAGD